MNTPNDKQSRLKVLTAAAKQRIRSSAKMYHNANDNWGCEIAERDLTYWEWIDEGIDQLAAEVSALSHVAPTTNEGEPETVPGAINAGRSAPAPSTLSSIWETADDPFCWYIVQRDITDEYTTVYSEAENCPGPNWKPLYERPVAVSATRRADFLLDIFIKYFDRLNDPIDDSKQLDDLEALLAECNEAIRRADGGGA